MWLQPARRAYTRRVKKEHRLSSYQDLLNRLQHFVRSEAETQRHEIRRQWSRSLAERVASGHAIEGLVVNSVQSSGLIILECHTNESRFREGDYLVIHRGDPEGVESVHGVLEYDDETYLEVNLGDGNPYFLKTDPSGWIADQDVLDLSRFYLDALDEVADTLRGREYILPLLAGDRESTLDYARYERGWEMAYQAGLDESQCEALAQAYAADLVHLIQGPPGTGKTFVLAHLVRLLVAEGQRVLITALTHRAINNALNKIVRVDPALPVCKIGLGTRAGDLLAENYENFAASGFGDLAGGYAVGATPFATRSNRLSDIEFDVAIFDEASQITLPLAIMGMLPATKYVFIGDERQLPPVITSRASVFGRSSIFAYLNGRGDETMLTFTYRLNDDLVVWPGRTFYEGLLKPAPGVGERRLQLEGDIEKWSFILDPRKSAVFLNVDSRNTTVRNRREAELVCDLVIALIRAKVPPSEIGVVVPYRAQGRIIRNLLRSTLPAREMLAELVVDTVERMQGQEREVVLVSFTTSSPAFAAQLAEFFFQPERLNVAITRPRTKLLLIGSQHMLKAVPDDPQLDSWVALLRDLIAHCATYSFHAGKGTWEPVT